MFKLGFAQCHLVKNISFVKKAINYDPLFCVMCRTVLVVTHEK